jgi:hypothetical protein
VCHSEHHGWIARREHFRTVERYSVPHGLKITAEWIADRNPSFVKANQMTYNPIDLCSSDKHGTSPVVNRSVCQTVVREICRFVWVLARLVGVEQDTNTWLFPRMQHPVIPAETLLEH